MRWSDYLGLIVQGGLTGLVYGLMALGLSVIFGVVRVVNFAHGEFTVVAMYVAWLMFRLAGIDPLLSMIPIAAAFLGIGYVMQRALVNRFIGRAEHEQFILLVGLAIVLVNGMLLLFGADGRPVDVSYGLDSVSIGTLLVDKVRLYAAIAAVAAAAALLSFFRFTRIGTAIRACADNLLGAAIVGLDIKHLYALAFGLGLACVGGAGALMETIADARPELGPVYTLFAFVIVIVGGLGSMTGALAGGVLIGVSEEFAAAVLPPSMKSMVSFALLILVLAVRPQGIMGRRA